MNKDPFEFTPQKLSGLTARDIGLIEVSDPKPIPLFFQTGYLTVDTVTHKNDKTLYFFKTPNKEVKEDFDKLFSEGLINYFKLPPQKEDGIFAKSIILRDSKKLTKCLELIFSSIVRKYSKRNHNLYFFHAVLIAYCFILAERPIMEAKGSKTSQDLILHLKNERNIYAIIELKHKAETFIDYSKEELNKVLLDLAQSALDYIETKEYDVPFKLHSNEIIKIGVGVYASGNCLALIKPR